MKLKKIGLSILSMAIAVGVFAGCSSTKPHKAEASQSVTLYNQWKKAYVGGKTQKYVKSNNGQGATKAVPEGQGYGMLATVLAAKKGANTHTTFN